MDDEALLAMADATAASLGLTIPVECRAGVARSLGAILEQAEIAAAGLDDAPLVEVAPIYRA